MTDQLTDRQTGLTELFTNWLIEWLTDWRTDREADWPTGRLLLYRRVKNRCGRISALWVEIVWNRRIQFIDKDLFLMSSGVREQASEWMSAAEHTTKASSAEQANEWAVRMYERMALYSTHQFHILSTQCAICSLSLYNQPHQGDFFISFSNLRYWALKSHFWAFWGPRKSVQNDSILQYFWYKMEN